MDKPPHSPERPDSVLAELYRSYAQHLIVHGEIDTQLSLKGEEPRYSQFGREAHTYREIVNVEQLRLSDRPDLTRIVATYESSYVLEGQVVPNSLDVVIEDRDGLQKQMTLQERITGVSGFVVVDTVEQPLRWVIPQDPAEVVKNLRLRQMALDQNDISLLKDALRILTRE